MRGSGALSFAFALAMLPTGALAEECVVQTSRTDVDLTLPNGDRYYYVEDCIFLLEFPCEDISIWIYQEANGVDGLQRRDSSVGDRSCGNPDKVIF